MMNSVTIDEASRVALGQAKDVIEVRDRAGQVLGYFAPIARRNAALLAEALAHCDLEELKRRRNSTESGIPTATVLKRLEILQQENERRLQQGEAPFTPDEGVAFIEKLQNESNH
ncbi:MAG: hypothetical protein AB7K24_23750 [Gemmataceae bacterium]